MPVRVLRLLRFLVCIVCVAGAFAASDAAGAEPPGTASASEKDEGARERSRAAFRRGVALVKEENYAAARDAFDEAYRLYAHPSILLNLGLARAKTGEYVEAERNLLSFLVDDGGAAPDEQKGARAALAEVRMHLGTLLIQVAQATARATLDRKPIPLVSGGISEVRVVAGEHALHVEAEGYVPLDQALRVEPGRSTSRSLALASESPAAVTVRETPGGSNEAASSRTKTIGWSLVAVSAATLGFGAYAGLRALSLSDDYERTGVRGTKSTGMAFRTFADVSILVGLASAGIGLYLLLQPSHPTRSARLVVGPAHTAIVGSF
ncbi:hypothetical protein [Pendulispora albinea]|uniref:PEGA domain-containing protein n=1 Tax=Pendulispora albinea TaxID=2741071 RepID=A0ABZ2LUY1_9BACT